MLCVSETDPIPIPYKVSDGDSGINQETIISVKSVPKNAAKIQTLQPVRNAKFPFISYGYKIQEQVILAITIGRTKTKNNRVKTQSWTIKTFLFGAFLVKSARLLQWLVFFCQTTELTLYVPLFSTDFNRSRGNPGAQRQLESFSQERILSKKE